MVANCYAKGGDIRGGNINQQKRSAVPRHTEIDENLARKICKDLGVPRFK
jgi:hypothetical protein